METAHGAGAGEALVSLDKTHAAHEGCRRARLEVAKAVCLGEIAAVIPKPGKTDRFHFWDREVKNLENLHPCHSIGYQLSAIGYQRRAPWRADSGPAPPARGATAPRRPPTGAR